MLQGICTTTIHFNFFLNCWSEGVGHVEGLLGKENPVPNQIKPNFSILNIYWRLGERRGWAYRTDFSTWLHNIHPFPWHMLFFSLSLSFLPLASPIFNKKRQAQVYSKSSLIQERERKKNKKKNWYSYRKERMFECWGKKSMTTPQQGITLHFRSIQFILRQEMCTQYLKNFLRFFSSFFFSPLSSSFFSVFLPFLRY